MDADVEETAQHQAEDADDDPGHSLSRPLGFSSPVRSNIFLSAAAARAVSADINPDRRSSDSDLTRALAPSRAPARMADPGERISQAWRSARVAASSRQV